MVGPQDAQPVVEVPLVQVDGPVQFSRLPAGVRKIISE